MEGYKIVRNQLIGMLEELDENLGAVGSLKVSEPHHPYDASITENMDDLKAFQEVEKIKQTMQLIGSGDYGVCINCGNAITQARLAVFPYTRHCQVCIQK